jgi:hypothetical protein
MTELERYCLSQNPFEPVKPSKVFKPVSQQLRLVRLAGFRGLAELDAYLKRRIDENQPALVLVAGLNHSGRTSVARFVLNRYAELRGVKQTDYFLLPEVETVNSSPLDMHCRWLRKLHKKVMGLDKEKADQAILNEIQAYLDKPDTERTLEGLSTQVYKLVLNLHNLPAGVKRTVGMLLDDVPTGSIIVSATKLLEDTPTIVVATETITDDGGSEALLHFKQLVEKETGHIIWSAPLTGKDMAELAKEIWMQAESRPECPRMDSCPNDEEARLNCKRKSNASPFICKKWDEDVKKAKLPVTHALQILSYVLNKKVRGKVKGFWPGDASLKITDKDIVEGYEAFQHFSG